MTVREVRFRLVASIAAATFVFCAGLVLWKHPARESGPRSEIVVAWECAASTTNVCEAIPSRERCVTCHVDARGVVHTTHPGKTFGCVACHGGDGLAFDKDAAHRNLAKLGRSGTASEVPEVQARCAMCHAGALRLEAPSRGAEAWAQLHDGIAPRVRSDDASAPILEAGRRAFRELRCASCHAATESSAIATPLPVLALRSTPTQLQAALHAHGTQTGIAIQDDAIVLSSLEAHLASIAQTDVAIHRAAVPGSSADEGRVLFARLGCVGCHPSQRTFDWQVDLAPTLPLRTPDWIAYWLAEPHTANPASQMPSFRLQAREAASLARHLVNPPRDEPARDRNPIVCPTTKTSLTPAACGAELVRAERCGNCHGSENPPMASSLAHFGETYDGAGALRAIASHALPRYAIPEATQVALATYLSSQRTRRVRPDLTPSGGDWEIADGAAAFRDHGCPGCHELDARSEHTLGPSLFGEGLRVRPQWLFEFLRDPGRHAVRPSLHPELGYRELVPADRTAVRMPSYAIGEDAMAKFVRFFAARDGASYPYAATTTPVLQGETLTSALRGFGRACLTCHSVAMPSVERMREAGDKLAPPLAIAHERLRATWIEACILQPTTWAGPAMTMDPVPREHAPLVRDLVLLLRPRTVLPPVGSEGIAPALGLGDL